MFRSPEFWVAVALVIFLGIAWRMGAFKTLLAGLDNRGRRIRAELDEAKSLREEASRVLADYTARREAADREAGAIVAAAREEAERVAREAHDRLTEFVKRRTAAAEQKIAQAETAASQQVRAAAAEAAVRISETVLREQMGSGGSEALMARSLGEARAKLHA